MGFRGGEEPALKPWLPPSREVLPTISWRSLRMGDGAFRSGPNQGAVFGKYAGRVTRNGPLPLRHAFFDLVAGQINIEPALVQVDNDDVAFAQRSDWTAHLRFGSDVADAQSFGSSAESAVSHQRDLFAQAFANDGGGNAEHFPHAGTAFRPFV